MREQVYLQATQDAHLVGTSGEPTLNGPQARRKFVQIYGLDHIVVRARIKPGNTVGNAPARGHDEHDAARPLCTRTPDEIDAAAVRQTYVDDDGAIGHKLVGGRQPRGIGGRNRLDPVRCVPILGQAGTERPAQHGIVLNEKQAHWVFLVFLPYSGIPVAGDAARATLTQTYASFIRLRTAEARGAAAGQRLQWVRDRHPGMGANVEGGYAVKIAVSVQFHHGAHMKFVGVLVSTARKIMVCNGNGRIAAPRWPRIPVLLLSGLACLPTWAGGAVDPEFVIVVRDHRFTPAELHVPKGVKVRIVLENAGDTPEEFDSHSLNREKHLLPHSRATLFIGPLDPGRYLFEGENSNSPGVVALGVVVVE